VSSPVDEGEGGVGRWSARYWENLGAVNRSALPQTRGRLADLPELPQAIEAITGAPVIEDDLGPCPHELLRKLQARKRSGLSAVAALHHLVGGGVCLLLQARKSAGFTRSRAPLATRTSASMSSGCLRVASRTTGATHGVPGEDGAI